MQAIGHFAAMEDRDLALILHVRRVGNTFEGQAGVSVRTEALPKTQRGKSVDRKVW